MLEKNVIQLVVGLIATNCWIYPFGDGDVAVIDPGDNAKAIVRALEKYVKTSGQQISTIYILLTHGHFDHTGAIPQIVSAFPGKTKIAIHSQDSEFLGPNAYKNNSLGIKVAMGSTAFIDAIWQDLPPADILLEEGSVIGCLTVLHLPGHSLGSAAFYDKEAKVIFTGDTLFKRGYGRTDLPGGSTDQLFKSLRRLFEMDSEIKVYPGHGQATTIGKENR